MPPSPSAPGEREHVEIKIEKGVPLPIKYPLAEMQVGDSFVVSIELWKNAHSAAHKHAERHGRKISGRSLVENGVRVYRIWRAA